MPSLRRPSIEGVLCAVCGMRCVVCCVRCAVRLTVTNTGVTLLLPLPYAVLRSKNLTAEIQTLRCKVTNLPSVSQGRLAPDARNKFVFRTSKSLCTIHAV